MLGMEEPSSFSEAEKEASWQRAMQEEIKSIQSNGTRSLVDAPKGQNHRLEMGIQIEGLKGLHCQTQSKAGG